MSKVRKSFLLIILLLFLILCIFSISSLFKQGTQTPNLENTPQVEPTINSVDEVFEEGIQDLVLNFKSGQVVITGFPWANKNILQYKHRLFNIVYLGYVNSDEQFIEEYFNSVEDFSGIYIASMERDSIFLAMGQSLWHEMDLITKAQLNELSERCSVRYIELHDQYQATELTCSASGNTCFLPIDNSMGILYKSYQTENSEDNFCEIAKQNGIISVNFRSY